MASTIMHLCVAKKINEKLHLDEKEFFLGAIAPDISKHIGESKVKSHFLSTSKDNVPNIREFLNKYKDKLNKPFNLGYFVHLYTDKVWFDEFQSQLVSGDYIHLLDNTVVKVSKEEISRLIYNDYTNLNISLIDYYGLDLSLCYEKFVKPDSDIEEIPSDKLNLLLDKMAFIIMESQKKKDYLFNMNIAINFIDYCSDKIINKIYEYQIDWHNNEKN